MKHLPAFCFIFALSISSLTANAQDATNNPTLSNDWQFSLGAAFTDSDPKAGLARDGNEATLIDLDKLGVDSDDTDFYFHAHWQGLERWRFAFTSFISSADGGRFTDQDYTYGDLTIPEGSGVSIDAKAQFYILNAHYALWQKPTWEAGVGIGVYALDWDATIGLKGGDTSDLLASEAEEFLAPLPTLAVWGRWALSDRIALRAGVDWLSLTIDEYDGEVLAGGVALDWWFNDRWGLSAGLNVVDVEVVVDDEPFNEFLEANWESVSLSLNFAF